VSAEVRESIQKVMLSKTLLNQADGAATVSNEWSRIFPDYKFKTVEDFLASVFADA
jgi:hypothetical protein